MDLKRSKLIVRLLERLYTSIHNVSSLELLSSSTFQVNYSHYNYKENVTQTYNNIYQINDQQKVQKLNTFPLQSSSNIQSISPSMKYKAVIQKPEEKKQILEIYQNEDLQYSLNLSEYHQQIFSDSIIGQSLIWNKSENKILYVAQAKAKTQKTYFEANNDEEFKFANENYQLQQDFGEKMAGTTQTLLFEYDLQSKTLYQISIPSDILICYPQYLSDNSIIYSGYKDHKEFKYGILHCFNRNTNVYLDQNIQRKQLYPKLEKEQEKQQENQQKEPQTRIISTEEASFRPILSPKGDKLVYFGAPIQPAHLNYLSMKLIELNNDFAVKEILPVKNEVFYGICGYYDDLKNMYWLNDNKHFIFTSNQQGSCQIFMVNTETKEVYPISKNELLSDAFQILEYDQSSNIIYASVTNMKGPSKLVFAHLNLSLETKQIIENIQWNYLPLINNNNNSIHQLQQSLLFPQFEETLLKQGEAEGFLWRLKSLQEKEIFQELQELYENNEKINPLKYSQDNQRPLVVMVHGGPHGNVAGNFGLLKLYFLLQGYSILAPNYTGSCGYGQEFVDKLLTKNGDIDAKEILGMIDQVIEKGLCDPKKIIVMGGSYGGYMTGIMGTKYHERFLCGILMNPVLNIAYNFNSSDIPEWSLAECFDRKMNWNLTPDDYKRMFEMSPACFPNKLPSINFVGLKDRRVPYHQSISFHAQSISNQCDYKTYTYPESGHALDDSLATVFDIIMKSILFIESQLLK